TIVAWGSDGYGQAEVPSGLSDAVGILAAWNYSLALRSNGTVVGWGINDSGQIAIPGGLANVSKLSGSLGYCLALKTDGTVVSWGFPPASPGGLSGVTALAAG